jgi:hypothetical protein
MMNFDSNYSGPLAAYGGLPVDVGGMWGGGGGGGAPPPRGGLAGCSKASGK